YSPRRRARSRSSRARCAHRRRRGCGCWAWWPARPGEAATRSVRRRAIRIAASSWTGPSFWTSSTPTDRRVRAHSAMPRAVRRGTVVPDNDARKDRPKIAYVAATREGGGWVSRRRHGTPATLLPAAPSWLLPIGHQFCRTPLTHRRRRRGGGRYGAAIPSPPNDLT